MSVAELERHTPAEEVLEDAPHLERLRAELRLRSAGAAAPVAEAVLVALVPELVPELVRRAGLTIPDTYRK